MVLEAASVHNFNRQPGLLRNKKQLLLPSSAIMRICTKGVSVYAKGKKSVYQAF